MIKKLRHKIIRLFKKAKKSDAYIDNSAAYWEQRYVNKKNSGAGSYGRLAQFKAAVLNDFVAEKQIKNIIEFGCGDGHQLSLAQYPNYTGIDVSEEAVRICKDLFRNDHSKLFYTLDHYNHYNLKAELTLSLDVIFHLVEDAVFENYMHKLFDASTKFVIIYSSNYEKYYAKHVRSRKFTDWIDSHISANWHLIQVIKNKYPYDKSAPDDTSFSDFYIYEKL